MRMKGNAGGLIRPCQARRSPPACERCKINLTTRFFSTTKITFYSIQLILEICIVLVLYVLWFEGLSLIFGW
jgi:hypothetical protein